VEDSDVVDLRQRTLDRMSATEKAIWARRLGLAGPPTEVTTPPVGLLPDVYRSMSSGARVKLLANVYEAVVGKSYRVHSAPTVPTWHAGTMGAVVGLTGICVGVDHFYVHLQFSSTQVPLTPEALEEV